MLNKTRKPFSQVEKHFFEKNGFFCGKMSHSAENPKQSSMLTKRFGSGKSLREFDKKQFRKKYHSAEKTTVLKNKIWI